MSPLVNRGVSLVPLAISVAFVTPALAQDISQCKSAIAKLTKDSDAVGLPQAAKSSYLQALQKAQKAASDNDAQACLKYVNDARSALPDISKPSLNLPGKALGR